MLGTPVEHPFSSTFRREFLGNAVTNMEEACVLLGFLGDPQTQHTLLRYCLDACRVTHLLRSMDTTAFGAEVIRASEAVRNALNDAMGAGLDGDKWSQASLPLSKGGLGLKDPVLVQMAARMSAIANFWENAGNVGVPDAMKVVPQDFSRVVTGLRNRLGLHMEPLSTWSGGVPPPSFSKDHCSQRWWQGPIYGALSRSLCEAGSLRDRVRLGLQQARGTTQWMQVAPSEALGSKVAGPEYRALIRWWLGVPFLSGTEVGAPCPLCSEPMDAFGDHLVCCKKNGPWQRHNALQGVWHGAFLRAGIACRREVAVEGKERPADLLLPSFDPKGPLAIDFTIRHPLPPSVGQHTLEGAKALLRDQEDAKVGK